MKLFSSIFVLFLVMFSNLFAQDSLDSKAFNLNFHIGADVAKGLRIGALVYVSPNWSIEGSYGTDPFIFLTSTDQNERYSLGISWNCSLESRLIIGVAYIHSVFPIDKTTKQNLFSVNVGSFIFNESGIRFFYRGGFGISFKKNNSGNHTVIFPDIDIGISYNIF